MQSSTLENRLFSIAEYVRGNRSRVGRAAFTGAQRLRIVAILLALAACGGKSDEQPSGVFVPPVVEFQIVFEDDFDGNALDTAKWNVELGDGCPDLCGWGNNELQLYGTDNISVAGGMLRIEGRQELDGSYTSGRLNTNGTFDFEYGRIEVNARIPSGQGTWPAIWLLHSDPTIYGPWPLSGEIDIMEAFNYGVNGNNTTASTTHYGLPVPPFNGTSSTSELAANADTSFHEYAVEWEKGRMRFFIDGVHFQSQILDNWFTYYPANEDGLYDPIGAYTLGLEDAPFDQAFHLLINFAIGGNPVGDPDASTVFPQTMEVDYVRVYECVNANPDTKRGCGSADASVIPLDDLDGGPLENANTATPFIDSVDLYLDAPAVVTVNFGADVATNTLQVGGFTGANATVTNDPAFPDPDDAENVVWHVSVAGDVANVFLGSEDLTNDPILDTGFDFSTPDPVGEIAFDMQVNSMTPGTALLVKLDSGFPNLGEVAIPEADILVGGWKTYSIKFDDLLANPGFVDCCGGAGVDLANVVNPFVFEVANGDADVYLDNVRVTNACYVVGACSASPRTKGIPDFIIFDDAINPIWDTGIAGADSGSGFANYTDGTDPANKANWAIVDDADPGRGQVIDVTFNDSSEFGVLFIQSTTGVDMSAYSAGALVFEMIVDDYGTNTTGMTTKADCFFPCTSGDKNLGVVADGVWETIIVPVSTLTATGLDLTVINTPFNIFPTAPQTGGIRFRIDNVRWEAETSAPPLAQINLPVTFDQPGVDYTLVDFGGAGSGLAVDPNDAGNMVASTTKGAGAETFAGTVIGTAAGFAAPIPFTATETEMSFDVFAPAAGIPILFRVENDDNSVGFEVMVTTTVANQWETLTADFASVGINTGVDYRRAIIFFDFGQIGTDTNFLWDNVVFGGGGPPPPPPAGAVDLPITFDDAIDYELADFGNVGTALVADPMDGTNMVASTNKPPGAETFGGTVVAATNGLINPIPLTATETTMTARVFSPDAGIPVRLKIENATDPTVSVETETLTTVAGAWETITFDFTNEAPGTAAFNPASVYQKVVIFFNFGTDGNTAGDKTYLWEDIALGGSGGPPPPASQPFAVFDDAADAAWDIGLAGTESPGFASITDGTVGAVVNWSVVAAADTNRGQVLEATIGGAAPEFGLFFIQSSGPTDLSAFAGGSVVFDINVTDYGTNTNGMIMKIDCGFPCTSGDTPIGVVGDGAWETVSIPVAQLVGTGLDLTTVNTGIVVFPDIADQQAGASVTFQIDDVRWEPEVLTNQAVFVDAPDALWDIGLAGTESPGFASITDGTVGNVVNWAVIAAADPARGQVIEATIGGAAPEFGLFFIQSSGPTNVSAFDRGAVVFDINVTDYGTNTNGMIMKIDCGFPCTSGDQPIGVVGNGVWETVSIEVSQLVGTGLDLTTVNTGLVVFPDIADQQAGATVVFQLDNIHWEP